MDIIASIRAEALRLGFSSIGFTEARLPPEARARLDAFLAAGMQGEMGWLADRAGVTIDFEIGDALAKLLRLGLVRADEAGGLHATPPAEALTALDVRWDGYYHYSP